MSSTVTALSPASPAVITPNEMSFLEAMSLVIEQGKKVTRVEWDDKDTYIFFGPIGNSQTQYLGIHNSQAHGQNKPGSHAFIIHDGDISAIDWIIVDESRAI